MELFVKDNKLVRGLQAASAGLKALGASIQAVGTRLAGLGVTLAVPFLGAAKLFADMRSDLLDMSQRTGVAVEALSELRYASEQSGSGAEDLEKGLRTMSRNIIEAARGSAEARRNLARLGLTVADLSGLSPDQQFEMIADRLPRIQNPAHRATIALEIFGKTGANLLPLLSGGADGIRELRRQARQLGLTMSSEDAEAAEAFGDSLDTLWKTIKRLGFAIGAALVPTLHQIAQLVAALVARISDWLDRNRELVAIAAGVVAALTAIGVALLLLGPAITAMGAAIGLVNFAISAAAIAVKLLGVALAFLLSPIGLVIAVVGGLAAAVLLATDEGHQALTSLGQGFEQLSSIASTTWQGIRDAIAAGDLAGAMEVAWRGIQVAWETGLAAIS
ncbi:MAG: phage tail tape measure protein [Gemmatales bacterium]|nr:phage tail tape measure protein [Gemmatales bacterium]MDW7995361.1 phage tail tape measure protein [Gemmatales bacterium]